MHDTWSQLEQFRIKHCAQEWNQSKAIIIARCFVCYATENRILKTTTRRKRGIKNETEKNTESAAINKNVLFPREDDAARSSKHTYAFSSINN